MIQIRCKACNKHFNPEIIYDRFNKPTFTELCIHCTTISTRGVTSEDLSEIYGLDKGYRNLIHTIEQEEIFENE